MVGVIGLSSGSPYRLDIKTQKIEYIIERESGFPSVQSLMELLEEARDEEYLEVIRDERNALAAELEALSSEDFDRRFGEVRQAIQNDVDRFCKAADLSVFTQWVEKDAWTPAEALSLWLGLDPRFGDHLIAWAQRNCGLAMAAVEIKQRWELINRAMCVGALVAPFRPRLFADWAQDKRELPTHFVDWMTSKIHGTASTSAGRALEAEVEQLKNERDRLRKKLEELDKPHFKLSVKLFAVLCVGVYGFRPNRKNVATKVVTALVEKYIIDRSEKTTLEYIRSAIGNLYKGDIDKLSKLYSEEFGAMGKLTISFGKLP